MISVERARELLDLGSRIGAGSRADEQLAGVVAVHNLLESQRVAYLADEVGMGKTYVALGAVALFRHFRPDFRVLVIAPRENIQTKWMKEFRNFVGHNVRFADLRMKALDGGPVRSLIACDNLLDLVHEVTIDPNRDFFLRMTSFSLPVTGKDAVEREAAVRLRDELRRHLPWMDDEVFDLRRNKQEFKDNFARAICCALPKFDLVIVDEAHNLKHGFGEQVSARNRVLALAMGRATDGVSRRLYPGYSARAERVLFLSATPVEETYRHLWNQLDVFGLSERFASLRETGEEEETKRSTASQFLIRRVTSMKVGTDELTKNLYRREWRRGGMFAHDEPITVEDDRARLVLALVQKKVSELLADERFNHSYQIGMLASFESFLETTKVKRGEDETGTFDDADQTDDSLEKEGIDVRDVNRIAKSYRQKFQREMPHPKMDAVVRSLATSWTRGEKSLVFVRRVASVRELKRKLDDEYDAWLTQRLMSELPVSVHARLTSLVERYRADKERNHAEELVRARETDEKDEGGTDTFFAWFFRGKGPAGVLSGANIQQRFIQRGAVYATFFEDNHVARLLGYRPGLADGAANPRAVENALAATLGVTRDVLHAGLRVRSARFLRRVKRHTRGDRFEAIQAAAIEWLKDRPGDHREAARVAWHERFESAIVLAPTTEPPEIGSWLDLATFFTELRQRPELRDRLWPASRLADLREAFREESLRAQLLATAARLGHAFIDLYVMTIKRLGSLELRAQEMLDEEREGREVGRIHEYLDLLEQQRTTPPAGRFWGAFDELSAISENFDLVLDVNEPEVSDEPLSETARRFGQLLRKQQPVGGMSGRVNQTLVRQFRMPGYPLVLITTDLLQEGEDLHTFCSAVHHYGISWTPSSMEQRIGRIDRVRSDTDRRLSAHTRERLDGDDMLQVYFPHLEDTVEVLQVRRVLERMNTFLRLMHEGLSTAGRDERTIDAKREFATARRLVPVITERLRTAFPIRPENLTGDVAALAVSPDLAAEVSRRFDELLIRALPNAPPVTWEPRADRKGAALGTAQLERRVQPFTLLLGSVGERALVRCISPVGRIRPGDEPWTLARDTAALEAKLGAILGAEDRTYDLTVESDVLLTTDPETNAVRVGWLIRRVVEQADQLEQQELAGRDEPLATFRKELAKEELDDC